MEESAESCGEDPEKNHAIMTPSNDINICCTFVDISPVYVEADDGADSNDLRRQGRCNCHEGDQ